MNDDIIILHRKQNNSVILVNANNIIIIDTCKSNDNYFSTKYFSRIYIKSYLDDTPCYVDVNETNENIYTKLPSEIKNSFIKLHNAGTNLTIYLNYKNIYIVDAYTDNSKIFSNIIINDNAITSFIVNETPEKIYSMIEKQYKHVLNDK